MRQIDIVDVVPRLAVVVRKSCRMDGLLQAQQDAMSELEPVLQGRRDLVGQRLTLWRFPFDGTIDYAPGFLVHERFAPYGGVSLETLPAGRAAHLRLHGPFEGLPDAWRDVFQRCEAQGLALAGSNWEVYSLGSPPEEAGADLYALLR